jgi:hypothetical protein
VGKFAPSEQPSRCRLEFLRFQLPREWLKMKNFAYAAVRREAEEDWKR